MKTIPALVTGLLMAAAGTAASALLPGASQLPALAGLFAMVGIGSALLVAAMHRQAAAPAPAAGDSADATDNDARESGVVKWFNANKGFGFIVRGNGEEIFVHFRSIRGDGRRALRDGQAVLYRVAQTDKGPQAEDVEPA